MSSEVKSTINLNLYLNNYSLSYISYIFLFLNYAIILAHVLIVSRLYHSLYMHICYSYFIWQYMAFHCINHPVKYLVQGIHIWSA